MSAEMLKELMQRSEALTPEEKLRLATHLVTQATNGVKSETDWTKDSDQATETDTERQRERQWLSQHGEEHAGEWVALDGDRLLSHGTDGRQVLSDARDTGVAIPFVVRIEARDELPFGGW